MTKRFVVRKYRSSLLRRTVYQVIDTNTENWVYESFDKTFAASYAQEQNAIASEAQEVQP